MNKTKTFIALTLLFSLIALVASACGGAGTATNGEMKKIIDKKTSNIYRDQQINNIQVETLIIGLPEENPPLNNYCCDTQY